MVRDCVRFVVSIHSVSHHCDKPGFLHYKAIRLFEDITNRKLYTQNFRLKWRAIDPLYHWRVQNCVYLPWQNCKGVQTCKKLLDLLKDARKSEPNRTHIVKTKSLKKLQFHGEFAVCYLVFWYLCVYMNFQPPLPFLHFIQKKLLSR